MYWNFAARTTDVFIGFCSLGSRNAEEMKHCFIPFTVREEKSQFFRNSYFKSYNNGAKSSSMSEKYIVLLCPANLFPLNFSNNEKSHNFSTLSIGAESIFRFFFSAFKNFSNFPCL